MRSKHALVKANHSLQHEASLEHLRHLRICVTVFLARVSIRLVSGFFNPTLAPALAVSSGTSGKTPVLSLVADPISPEIDPRKAQIRDGKLLLLADMQSP